MVVEKSYLRRLRFASLQLWATLVTLTSRSLWQMAASSHVSAATPQDMNQGIASCN